MQEPALVSTAEREHVAHGLINTAREHAADREKFKLIKEACAKANADAFIQRLPQGTIQSWARRGCSAWRLRAQIVADPRILLLDKATSALDTQAEG